MPFITRKTEGYLTKLFFLFILLFVEITSATVEYKIEKSTQATQKKYTENISSPTTSHHVIRNITLVGTNEKIDRLLAWLEAINNVDKGRDSLLAIMQSNHQLTIQHSVDARLSAGRTIAPLTEDLINKKGASVVIIFDADMPDEGSYRVYNENFELIEFTAVQNLYHELAHAMHQMQGTWRYFASEDQAIEEENIFREQLALQHKKAIALRFGKDGEAITAQRTHPQPHQELQLSFNN